MQAITSKGNDYAYDHTVVHDGDLHYAVVKSTGSQWTVSTDGISPAKEVGLLSGRNRGQWFGSIASPSHISLGQHTAGSGKLSGNEHVGRFSEILIYDHPLANVELSHLAAYLSAKYGVGDERSASRETRPPPSMGMTFWLDAADLDANRDTPNPAVGTSIRQWKDRVSGITLQQPHDQLQPTLRRVGNSGAYAVDFASDFLIASEQSQAPFVHDRYGTLVVVFTATHQHEGYGFEVGGNGEFVSTVIHPGIDLADPIDQLIASGDPRISRQERRQIEYLASRGNFVKQHLKRLEPAAMSLRHSIGPPYEPGVPTSRIMNRGEYDDPGEIVQPGFLSVITGNQEPAAIRLDPFKRWPTRSRRMALANWIASAKNPMTARVMANRLWHWHFGQGIVQTPSDFGSLSGGPSHRELLDWLAVKFVETNWGIKAMHRMIVNSATYRQRSDVQSAQASEVDPDNRLLWRFNRRRLDAEAIRDSVLAVSGRLNPERFGLPIFPPLPGDVAEAVKYSESKWDTQYGPEGRKRSLYIYQQRTLTMPFMQTFDSLVCEESRPLRRVSITPLQALAMYNGDLVNGEAMHFAQRVCSQAGVSRSKQVELAFRLAFGRRPTVAESERMLRLIRDTSALGDGLTSVCRALYNANEFLYVD